MKVFVAVAAAAQLVAAAVDIHSIPRVTTGKYVQGSYIIGLNSQTHWKRGFSSPHAELEYDLQSRGVTYTITKTFSNSKLWNGAAIKLKNAGDLIQVAQAQGVTSINRNYLHDIPKRPAAAIAPINPVTIDKLTTHQMTGVNKLHAQGIFGKGITIGIIDTGIDYTHPALGGKFGAGNKVIGGYDFVGDAYTGLAGTPAPAPDNDPLDQCNGHGTHVAGIIGADPNNPYNISGVAYESSINAYRVFGCSGSVPDDILIQAMMKADSDGNDIITMSLGGPEGWSEGVTSVIASKIADGGKVVTIAAGNEGDSGSWYASGPATGLSTISVGSVDNTIIPVQNATDSTGRGIPYYSALTIANGTFPIYATSSNLSIANDACTPLPASTPDLSGYLVLIRRGGCAFTDKLDNAAAKGGKLFMISNNVEEPLSGITVGTYKAVLISKEDGDYLVTSVVPKNGTLTFADDPFNIAATTGGLMSSFSTYGPSFDMFFKPAFSAPGGNILSTYPVKLGAYAVESGTSMATPFTAGAAALYLQVLGKTADNAKAVRGAFQNTASYIPNSKSNTSMPETAAHAGAGLIQVWDAIYNKGSMLPAELLLNDTANFKGQQTVTIKNAGTKAVTYTLSHVPAGTANTIDGIENIFGPVPLTNAPATVTISPTSVTVQPGASSQVSVTITAPSGLDAKTFPVYSGFIQAKGSDGTTLHSSYLGVAAALKDMKVLDNTDAYFGVKLPFITDKDGNPVNGSTTYSMQGNDTPAVMYRLVGGSPACTIDLIDSKTNVTTNQRRSFDARDPAFGRSKHTLPHTPISKREDIESAEHDVHKRSLLSWLLSPKGAKAKTVSAATSPAAATTTTTTPIVGNLYFEDYLPRNALTSDPTANPFNQLTFSQFANGTAIPSGSYKVLLSCLRIASSETETWQSSEIVVKRA